MLLDSATIEKFKLQKPKFIVFEGINGAGKSSLIKLLATKFSSDAVVTTHEPGATTLGKAIRSIVLGQESDAQKVSPLAELLLFAADRAEHVNKTISPALEKKQTVLCDRYFYSTLAFQGYGRGLSLSLIDTVCSIAINGVVPDLVVLLDLDVKTALSRIKKRAFDKDSFESEELAFHERLRNGFLELAKTRPEPFLVLSANEPQEVLLGKLADVIL